MASRRLSRARRVELGLRASELPVHEQDWVWSTYSRDKPDLGEVLGRVIRTLNKSLPLGTPLRALSVGSSTSPQFRLLHATCQGGLSLLDIDARALEVVRERARRQDLSGVTTVVADLNEVLSSPVAAAELRDRHLDGQRQHVVLMHHVLYYTPRSGWDVVVQSAYRELIVRPRSGKVSGALHAVLMTSRTDDPLSTTALYNKWAGKFFGTHNDQDLAAFGRGLRGQRWLGDSQVRVSTTKVHFDTDDFEKFMAVVWMILLHPQVHAYSESQREEITESVYNQFWSRSVPLTQRQDHLVLYRGTTPAGLI